MQQEREFADSDDGWDAEDAAIMQTAILPPHQFDTIFQSMDCIEQTVEHALLKGFCVVDARHLLEVNLSELEGFASSCYDDDSGTYVADGLLGREGSLWIRECPGHGDEYHSKRLSDIDELLHEFSHDLTNSLPQFGEEASATHSCLHKSCKAAKKAYASKKGDNRHELTGRHAEMWLEMLTRARLFVAYFLGPGSGTLELQLHDQRSAETVKVVTGHGVLVVLRPEVVSASYRHESPLPAIAMSHFRLSDPVNEKARMRGLLSYSPFLDQLRRFVSGHAEDFFSKLTPQQRPWRNCGIWSTACNMPGGCMQAATMLQHIVAGCDMILEVPYARFDLDTYFDSAATAEECERHGKTYCKHGSFIGGAELFANAFFGLSPSEAMSLAPSARVGMEVAYEAAHHAGFQPKKNHPYHADVLVAMDRSEGFYSGEGRFPGGVEPPGGLVVDPKEANEIACVLGLKGYCCAVDTDGSSSLVALQLAQAQHGRREAQGEGLWEPKPLAFSVVVGSTWNLTACGFIAFSARGLMTREGRCFCFDQCASGLVRGEGAAAVLLSSARPAEAKEELDDPGAQSLGDLRSVAICTRSGKGASLTQAAGVNMEVAMDTAVSDGGVALTNIAAVECHASGLPLMDVVEACAAAKAVPQLFEDEVLPLTVGKSMTGNGQAASGLFALLRVLAGASEEMLGANNLLRELNPAILLEERNLLFVTEPCHHSPPWTGTMACINSFGFSGTFASAVVRADLGRASQEQTASPVHRIAPVAFWPAGGGELEASAVPERAYCIVGSFSEWERPIDMMETEPGVWETMIVLGENRWERFQIWLDGDRSRVLHPSQAGASRVFPALGPDDASICGELNWHIEGRPVVLEMNEEGPDEVLLELERSDLGLPGCRYQVSLHVAGGWRKVDWRNLGEVQRQGVESVAEQLSFYYVAGNWSEFELEKMEPDPQIAGLWRFALVLTGEDTVFYIIRNKDRTQGFFPEVDDSDDPSEPVLGPEENGDCRCWMLQGAKGTQMEIQFQRHVRQNESRRVSWSVVASGGRALLDAPASVEPSHALETCSAE